MMTQTMTKDQTAVEFIIEMIDNMVLNGADLGEDLPPLLVHIKRAKEIEQQQLSAERERSGKLVEALENAIKDPETGVTVVYLSVDVIKKILSEYKPI